ncbi:uncharacterized protein si:dkeyp-113d7.10 isoform X1 [Tachysurus fulvidraco]|uniref:uncharacterized protein si:dkeyp-113d7.10 isoform X1 n=1 Tax=Tachysurus fulvidraco TaxID=1234273 RepID=UPI001FEE04FD|nr:uncharacterized protein si:dkeyp-113d7.10 isoform X1 [Tachysurus fulvidraco]
MNGALYISFFQGQLESVLEQVVQVAVTEITGTVGGSLSSMLLETARKEQENQRLRDTLQSAGRAERESGETEDPEPQHAASRPAYLHDSVRHEQKRRAVGQLKVVMERVLEFAVRELSKIVEDSFDDVLLELRKTDRENEELMEKLRGKVEENGAGKVEINESQGDQVGSPNITDVVKEEERADEKEQGMEQLQNTEDSAPPTVISVSQDWVPVLDQVFGQKWCADIWPVKEPGDIKAEQSCFPSEEPIRSDSAPHRKDESQSDRPQWLQDAGALTVNFDTQQTSETRLKEDDVQLKSPSMLHRLLTLPSQLLDGEDESMESEESLLNAITSLHRAQTPHQDTIRADERDGGKDLEDQEELQGEEEEAKPRSCRSGRKNHACKTCGKKFSRAHLLKAHRLTHREAHSPFSKVHTHACNDSGKTT